MISQEENKISNQENIEPFLEESKSSSKGDSSSPSLGRAGVGSFLDLLHSTYKSYDTEENIDIPRGNSGLSTWPAPTARVP